jgi:hypothetical protein
MMSMNEAMQVLDEVIPAPANKMVDQEHLKIAIAWKTLKEEYLGRKGELNYLFAFVRENCFDSELCCDQLRSLWTTYCLHNELDPDTAQYDNDILALWLEVEATESDNVFWNDFDSFDNFMCCYLV